MIPYIYIYIHTCNAMLNFLSLPFQDRPVSRKDATTQDKPVSRNAATTQDKPVSRKDTTTQDKPVSRRDTTTPTTPGDKNHEEVRAYDLCYKLNI